MDVFCPPNPDFEHLYIPSFDGDDYLSHLPPIPPPFYDYYDDLPPQNEAPEKKTPPPLSPPGEADAEVDGPIKRKRIRHRKENSGSANTSTDAVPHTPPSPTPSQPKQPRTRGRPKDPPGGLFPQRYCLSFFCFCLFFYVSCSRLGAWLGLKVMH